MNARVTHDNDWVDVGTFVDVIGFVNYGGVTWAVYRDDYGALSEVPTWAIRMQPAFEDTCSCPANIEAWITEPPVWAEDVEKVRQRAIDKMASGDTTDFCVQGVELTYHVTYVGGHRAECPLFPARAKAS